MSEFHFSPRPNRAGEVHWRPWSEQAFAAAREADRPILLSISAVWCHWCHVMDETTYSDPDVIELVNREFVPIRVDNDVRPDINQRYNMGGWPTTAFLTPAGDILTGATYLPPDQMRDAAGRVAGYYREHQPDIAARLLEGRRRTAGAVAAGAGELDGGMVDRLLGAVENAYDARHGGFGTAPKFPMTDSIALLAEQAILRREPRLMEMARHTLAQMAGGGTYDHVEGGFFRYSTTEDWSVPHFEKMLEDHGGLLAALALTGQGEILDDAARYLETVLRNPDSGLYAGSQDADEDYYALDAAGRAHRGAPYVDRRVYVAWNCGLVVAYLEAAARLNRPPLRKRAQETLDRLYATYRVPGEGLRHTDGVGGQLGAQVWGLLATVRAGRREPARLLLEDLERNYGDPDLGGYFDRAPNDSWGRLGERLKPLAENAVAAIALHEMGETERARGALASVASLPQRYGTMAAVYARALDRVRRDPVTITTTSGELAAAALSAYPYAVLDWSGDGRVVICRGSVCEAPLETAQAVAEALGPGG